MQTTLVKTSLFDPLIQYVTVFSYQPSKGNAYLEISLPRNFIIDTDMAVSYLGKDAVLECDRFGARTLKGNVTTELGDYLYKKINDRE